ncbi:Glycerol-3-phosphate transporter [Balamuthia mandrillaris]
MILTGVFTALFGMAYIWKLHMFWYFVVVQVLCGIVQSTGWPAVVSVVGYWFGKGKRGFIMGVWNAHTSVGNILGSAICSAALAIGWGYSFIIPGGIIGALGVAIFLFLVVTPEDVGLDSPNAVVLLPNHHSGDEEEEENVITETETDSDVGSYGVGYGAVTSGSINPTNKKIKGSGAGDGEGREDTILLSAAKQKKQGINFFRAWMIPGVAEFAMALFFCKLVSYTFLYWLPFYLNHTEIGDDKLSTSESGNLSTLFDVGGIIGGIIAGLISDWLPAQATTSAVMMYISVPALYCYRAFGDHSYALNIVLMLVAGVFVNGPYSLITTAVSADLGTHSSLKGDAKALATVTAIIDGTGSMGAAVGPFITGWLSSTHDGWDRVFWMLMGMCGASALLLSRLLFKELRRCCAGPKEQAYLHDSDLPPKSFSFVDGGLEGGGGGDAPRMTQHQQQPQPQGFLHSPHQYFNQDASAPPMEATSPLYYHASGTSPFERAAFHRTDT